MSKIIILQGVPASGKSTYAKELHEKNKNCVIINRDSIRESRGTYWLPEQEDYISDIEEFEVRSAIKHGLTPIIDATNLNPSTIQKWENLAKELSCNIEIKPFKIDFKTALERDQQRPRPVGEKVLKSFFYKYFPKEMEEYFTDPRLKQNNFQQEIDINKENCIIVDIDGTLCCHAGRSPYDWSRVGEDVPNKMLIKLIRVLSSAYKIIVVSGREGTEECITKTRKWLDEYLSIPYALYMRKEKDMRHDEVIKKEIYERQIKPKYNVIAVFDDRDRVCDFWRSEGLLCNQVYYGDF